MSFLPSDHAAREHARRDRETTFVLEAGAGTGKTTLVVDRVESWVRSGTARLDEIAAVTFTENAAAEMKLRLRERLERVRADPGVATVERDRSAAALDVLERAQVSTIHALCAAILAERPLECGVVPGFRVADETETEALFARAWDDWLAERLQAGDAVLAEALRADIPFESRGESGERASLRGLARTLLWERDLVPLVAEERPDPEAWKRDLLHRIAEARELMEGAAEDDLLVADLLALAASAETCAGLEGPALVDGLLRLPKVRATGGRRDRWSSEDALKRARDIGRWAGEAVTAWKVALGARLHADLVTALKGVLSRYEEAKKQHGVLDFVDLLLKARNALRDRESVRRYFRQRFRHVVIDEFQDTDPLQVEIARLLTEEAPGRLMVVGDAKQSIYRFRRAEVSLFRRLSEEARERPGHAVLHLTQNFRSRPGILRFVNRAFAHLIQLSDEASQPGYEPIDPPPGLPQGPAVLALRFQAPTFAAGPELLEGEAGAIARQIVSIASGGEEVRDPATGRLRGSQAGDVMVLAPRLTQVRHLEEALEAAGLRFTVEGGKSFFNRQEVHEVLSVLRAADDPTDRVALVGALRSSFFGVSDRDLVAYTLAGGPLWIGHIDSVLPGADAVGPALSFLGQLHAERTRLSVPALLERLYDETRVLAALTGTRRGEAQVANLEKVVSLARRAGDLGVLTLRGFTRLLEERVREASEESDLPPTRPGDPGTVRILSIHKAKGLEAPVVVLYDQAYSLQARSDVIALWEEGRVAVGFRAGYRPPDWNRLQERDEARARAEGKRLLYVACTRARDLLVIPVPPKDAQVGDFWKGLASFVESAPADEVVNVDADALPVPAPVRDTAWSDVVEEVDAAAARWEKERADLIATASERPFLPISATRAAARTAPPAASSTKARGGRDFGTLVHRVLQWIPLGEPAIEADVHAARARPMARALAPSFALDAGAAERAAEAVGRALALPLMDRARRAPRLWRELPVWLPEEQELIEGVVDLVFEEDGALVVVDYKTDHLTPEQALDQAAHHAPQLRLYGRALALATGMKVKERLVLFTTLGRTILV